MEREAEEVDEEREDLSREGLPTLLPDDLLEVDGRPPLLLNPGEDRLLVGENRPPVAVLKRSLMERLAEEVVEETREGRRSDGRPILLPGCFCLGWIPTTLPRVSSLGCEGTGDQPSVSRDRGSGTRYHPPESKTDRSLVDAGYHSPTLIN